MNFYNEFDPNAAAWLRQLIQDGSIPKGVVDERSITELRPSDLEGFTQCHFFAGVGGWPYALRLAGWPPERHVWTASLPCQPFSSAGKQRGTEDERHLWPVFAELVRECRPTTILGEQVSSKVARDDWFTGVCMDLERMEYAAFGADLCSPCAGEVGEGRIVRGDQETWEPIILGAPHIRQRLYWVARRMADTRSAGREGRVGSGETREEGASGGHTGECSGHERMAETDSERHHGIDPLLRRDESGRVAADISQATGSGTTGGMADTPSDRQQRGRQTAEAQEGREQGRDVGGELPGGSEGRAVCDTRVEHTLRPEAERLGRIGVPVEPKQEAGRPGYADAWAHTDLIGCADGKARRVKSGIFPLAPGLPRGVVPSGDPGSAEYANATGEARVMRLKGYGNAICAPLAAMFIDTCMEVIEP